MMLGFLALVAAMLVGPAAGAQVAAPTPVVWKLAAATDGAAAAPGGELKVTVRAAVERGWYIYAMTQPSGGPTPLRITVPDGQPFAAAGPVTGPEPKRAWDAAFEIESAKHDGAVAFTVPLKVPAAAPERSATLQVQVRYQACSDTLCLRPKTETLSLPVEIRGAPPASGSPQGSR